MSANQAWISMFRCIPADLQEALALGLTTGSEIVVQKIVQLAPDFMIVRGRLAGTQDTGRIVLVPYGALTFVALTRMLKDPEVEAIFGKGEAPAAAVVPSVPTTEAPAPAAEAATVSEAPAAVNPAPKSDSVSKKVLLAKLRDRLKQDPGPGKESP